MKDIELVEVQIKYADDIWEFDAKRQRGKHEVFFESGVKTILNFALS